MSMIISIKLQQMSLLKLSLLVLSLATLVRAQFYTLKPKLRIDDDFFRTFKYSSTTRLIPPRPDPDSLFFGFFPIWSAALACLTGACLLVSLVGLLCWLAGCNNPRDEMRREIRKLKKKQLEHELSTMEEQLYDDISVRMLDNDTLDRCVDNNNVNVTIGGYTVNNTSTLFSNSKLISEVESEAKYLTDAKKKKFMRDHL